MSFDTTIDTTAGEDDSTTAMTFSSSVMPSVTAGAPEDSGFFSPPSCPSSKYDWNDGAIAESICPRMCLLPEMKPAMKPNSVLTTAEVSTVSSKRRLGMPLCLSDIVLFAMNKELSARPFSTSGRADASITLHAIVSKISRTPPLICYTLYMHFHDRFEKFFSPRTLLELNVLFIIAAEALGAGR